MDDEFNFAPLTLPCAAFKALSNEAHAEGFRFVDKFLHRWENGVDRFSKPGERLLSVYDGNSIIAFGGLNIDPYLNDPRIGRIRHLYVMNRFRGNNLGLKLITQLTSNHGFSRIRLRAGDQKAAEFYEKIGWEPTTEPDASHTMP